jgi:hypothetical protein
MYVRVLRPSDAAAHDCIKSRILSLTSWLGAAVPYAFRIDVKLSMNSREAISFIKCVPPFLTHVSVSCMTQLVSIVQSGPGYDTHIKGCQLHVWVFVSDAFLQGAHSFPRLYCLRSNNVRDLEV